MKVPSLEQLYQVPRTEIQPSDFRFAESCQSRLQYRHCFDRPVTSDSANLLRRNRRLAFAEVEFQPGDRCALAQESHARGCGHLEKEIALRGREQLQSIVFSRK